ncbi:hypothetical protein FSOLCH5_015182 [Fusarium solani]
MMKCQIGLGVLSIPVAFDVLGMIPGVICMMVIAALSTWGSYVIGEFKLNHREIYGIDDAAGIMFGRVDREIVGFCFILFLIFGAGSGMLSVSISFNAVSTHGTCTAVFVAVAAIIVLCFASLRTLDRISFLAWAGLFSILTSILIVTIAVGVQDRPDSAPKGPWKSDWKAFDSPSFTEAMTAISTFIFAYIGTPFYFAIVAETRNPRHYTKALILCQSVATITYLIIGIIIYYFSSKHFFLRILRGSKHLTTNTFIHWATWLDCVFTVAIVAYLIASGIPLFSGLVSLIDALLGTMMCFQPLGCMCLYDNWNGRMDRSLKWMFLVAVNVMLIVSGTFLMIGGPYGSVVAIVDSYRADGGSKAWACADNSNSV